MTTPKHVGLWDSSGFPSFGTPLQARGTQRLRKGCHRNGSSSLPLKVSFITPTSATTYLKGRGQSPKRDKKVSNVPPNFSAANFAREDSFRVSTFEAYLGSNSTWASLYIYTRTVQLKSHSTASGFPRSRLLLVNTLVKNRMSGSPC